MDLAGTPSPTPPVIHENVHGCVCVCVCGMASTYFFLPWLFPVCVYVCVFMCVYVYVCVRTICLRVRDGGQLHLVLPRSLHPVRDPGSRHLLPLPCRSRRPRHMGLVGPPSPIQLGLWQRMTLCLIHLCRPLSGGMQRRWMPLPRLFCRASCVGLSLGAWTRTLVPACSRRHLP